MKYYWFDAQELFQKAKYKYHNCGGKEKAAEYYLKNKDSSVIKEKVNNKHRNLSEEEKKQKENMEKIGIKKMKGKLS